MNIRKRLTITINDSLSVSSLQLNPHMPMKAPKIPHTTAIPPTNIPGLVAAPVKTARLGELVPLAEEEVFVEQVAQEPEEPALLLIAT